MGNSSSSARNRLSPRATKLAGVFFVVWNPGAKISDSSSAPYTSDIAVAYFFSVWSPDESLVPGGDGGRSRSLVDPTQGAIPGGEIVGIDENDNTIVEVLPSSSRQG